MSELSDDDWLTAEAVERIADAIVSDAPMGPAGEICVVCTPAGRPPLSPSVARLCAQCDRDVWLSLASLARIRADAPDADVITVCGPCGMHQIVQDDAVIMPPSVEELRVVRESTGRKPGQN